MLEHNANVLALMVNSLLAQKWQPLPYGTYDRLFDQRADDPSVYVYEDDGAFEYHLFKPKEALKLYEANFFGNHAVKKGAVLIVNEHAHHAVQDLLGKLSEAVQEFDKRMKSIPQTNWDLVP